MQEQKQQKRLWGTGGEAGLEGADLECRDLNEADVPERFQHGELEPLAPLASAEGKGEVASRP